MEANVPFWTAIIAAVGASLTAMVVSVVTLILNYLREGRTTATLERMEETGEKNLKLNNSALLRIQRELAAEKWKTARRPGATDDDVRAAEAMDRIVAEHEASQRKLEEIEAKREAEREAKKRK